MHKAPYLLAAALLALTIPACRGERGDIVIGAAGPFSETRGEFSRLGAELAIRQVNARGGIGGRRLVLRALDDSARGVTAVRVAETFVGDPAVVAVVGHVTSGAMMTAARVYDGQLAAVATTASSPELSGISPWVFRTIASDSAAAIEMARFATRAGYQRVAILYDNDSYGRALAMLFRRNFRGEIVSADPVSASETDFEPFVSYYRARRCDAIVVAGAEGGGLRFLREARRQALAASFLGANGWVGIAATDPVAAEGALIFAPFTPSDPRPEVQRFVQAFRKEFGRTPTSHAALAYDATLAVASAIEAAGADREAIRDHLAGLDERTAVAGVTGSIAFEKTGDRRGRGIITTRVHDGALTVGGTE